ncbi:hypothetical protein REPUB_Repub07fG0220500 [Reevesia pubescens]
MEDPNGLDKDKDKRTRERMNECKELVGQLVYMIVGDGSYLKRNWGRRIDLVRKAMRQLKDPQFVLKQLISLMQPIIMETMSSGLDVGKAESALQELQLFLQQSNNMVLDPDCANEIYKSLTDFIPLKAEALQAAKEESESFGEELKQIMAILEEKHQSMKEAKVYATVANMLQKVVNSCSNIAAYDILNKDCTNQIQGHHGVGSVTFEVEGKQLRLNFAPTPDPIEITERGKNAEVHNQEINQEKQGKEVILTIGLVAGRLAELKLAMEITNQEMGDLEGDSSNEGLYVDTLDIPLPKYCGSSWDLDSLNKFLMVGVTDSDEGPSNAAPNEANVKPSPDEICNVKGYKVFNRNADVLDEIFEKHPNIAVNFRISHPDLQSPFMNSLAEVYQKIKSKHEMVELKDMEVKIEDMERTGLQLSWLKEMLAEVRESLENQVEKKRLQEEIDSFKAKAKEAEQKLAKLEKKPRFY